MSDVDLVILAYLDPTYFYVMVAIVYVYIYIYIYIYVYVCVCVCVSVCMYKCPINKNLTNKYLDMI